MRPLRKLNRYYRENAGFREWVRKNEEWLRDNPDVYAQLLKNPQMLNLFVDLMLVHSSRIQRKLRRYARKQKR